MSRRCFSPGAPTHLDGAWRLRPRAAPPYRLRLSDMEGVNHHYYGVCADRREEAGLPAASQYEWVPKRCSLRPLAIAAAALCSKLEERRVLFVGDSNVEQLFFSFVMLLGGNVSSLSTIWTEYRRRNRRVNIGVRSKDRLQVRTCGGRLAVQLVRNDLLLWSATKDDIVAARTFRRFPVLMDFRTAVTEADVVVLGSGHHFANYNAPFYKIVHSFWDDRTFGASGLQWETYFRGNLNHTLARVFAVRRTAGFSSGREGVIITSPTRPVPKCWEHDEPIDVAARRTGAELATRLEEATFSDLVNRSKSWKCARRSGTACTSINAADSWLYFAAQWAGFGLYRRISRDVAAAAGVAYLDIHFPSALRPDAALAKHVTHVEVRTGGMRNRTEAWLTETRRILPSNRDCLHYCLPGPTDEFGRLLFSLMLDQLKLTWPAQIGVRAWRRDPELLHTEKPAPHQYFKRVVTGGFTLDRSNHIVGKGRDSERMGDTYGWWPRTPPNPMKEKK